METKFYFAAMDKDKLFLELNKIAGYLKDNKDEFENFYLFVEAMNNDFLEKNKK